MFYANTTKAVSSCNTIQTRIDAAWLAEWATARSYAEKLTFGAKRKMEAGRTLVGLALPTVMLDERRGRNRPLASVEIAAFAQLMTDGKSLFAFHTVAVGRDTQINDE